ncbi:MAG: hypothetical protein ACI305_00350 [Lepagella sp.]
MIRRRMLFSQNKADIIVIDQTNDDPFMRVSGDVNGKIIQWIRANSHRVLAKKTADGEVTYCRLDDTDSTKYHDGTTAALDGSEGDVFMKMPEFYYKGTEGDIVSLYFARKKLDDGYVIWSPNILIGVYESYIDDHNMYSRSGVASASNTNQFSHKAYAAARGTGYQLVDWQMHCVMGCLYYAMYGNTDCQGTIGTGGEDISNKATGQTDSLGMADTVAGGNGDSQSINFWGLENWWGNKDELIHDYLNPARTSTASVNDPVNGGTRQLALPTSRSTYWVKKMKFGQYLDLVITDSDPKDGTSSTGYCDIQRWPSSTNTKDRVGRRSGSGSISSGGVAHIYADDMISNEYSSVGSRLAFRGTCVEETDVEAFKAIDIPSAVYGVFIEATDGTLYKSTEWTGAKTANSIVVKDTEASFRMALVQNDGMYIHSTNYTYSSLPPSYTTSDAALLDMDPETNMTYMLNSNSSTSYAAGFCDNFTFPDGATKGLLPSLGWLKIVLYNKSEVDACLSACGATAMDAETDYWSSTYYKRSSLVYYFWSLSYGSNSIVGKSIASNSICVRPFAAL